MRKKQGWFLVILLCLIPIVLWLLTDYSKFHDLRTILRSLGKITGLVGLVLFSISFLFSTRWRPLEPLFGGLNRVYIAHHIIGGIAFILLLAHPLLLAVRIALVDFDRAFNFLLPNRESAIYGWLSLAIMIVFLFVTFFWRLPYQIWRMIHLLSGPAFLFGVAHTFVVTSDVLAYRPLFIYMLVICSIGIFSYLYRLAMQTIFLPKLEYRVTGVNRLREDVVEVMMKPLKKPLHYESGQFIYVSFYDPQARKPNLEAHPFTISSSSNEDELKVVIKALGDYTKKVQSLHESSYALIEGPYGRFSFKNAHRRKQIWIAGGIGVTPFLGMARSLTSREQKYNIDLYYAANSYMEAVFLSELQMIDRHYENFRLITRFADKDGFLSADFIKEKSGDLLNADILLCGPPVMTKNLTKQFKKDGVKYESIFTEEFDLT